MGATAAVAPVVTPAVVVTERATGAPLEQLLVIQQHDTAVDQLRHRRTHLPARADLAAAERGLARLGRRRAELDEARRALANQQGALEGDVTTLEHRRTDLNRRLASGTVPKELERLSAEVAGITARIGELEDRELELMEALEPIEAELDELAREEAGLDLRRSELRTALQDAETEIDRELTDETAARHAAARDVPAELLSRYEQLRARLGGVAVARLVGGRCTGCNLLLPTSEVDRIRHEDPGVVVTCEQCGRLLVR